VRNRLADPATAARRLRIGVDVTPLLGRRTGIGRYVENLIVELAAIDSIELRAAAFSLRGRSALASLPAAVHTVHRPAPARLLNRAWMRGDLPPAEWLTGRVDVVHGTNFVLPPPRSAAGVVTVHDLSFLHYRDLVEAPSLAYRELVPRALARAAAVLTPSQAVADELIEAYRLSPDTVRVTPLGVDQAWLSAAPRQPPGIPTDYLLAVGTLEPRKGLDVLIAAYRILLAEEPQTPPLVLVGPAGWGPELDTSGIARRQIVLPGYLQLSELRGLVAGARALVFPSRYEGFGLPPLEALAAGTPVVASDIPAVREVVGSHARLVPVDDIDALADALRTTLTAPPSSADRTSARSHASTFTWRRCAELTATAYQDAAGR
jgi:glycosyltransferase involved in cell wall biosynthesis